MRPEERAVRKGLSCSVKTEQQAQAAERGAREGRFQCFREDGGCSENDEVRSRSPGQTAQGHALQEKVETEEVRSKTCKGMNALCKQMLETNVF